VLCDGVDPEEGNHHQKIQKEDLSSNHQNQVGIGGIHDVCGGGGGGEGNGLSSPRIGK